MFGKKKEEKAVKEKIKSAFFGIYIDGISGVGNKGDYAGVNLLDKDTENIYLKIGDKDVILPIGKIQAIEIGTETEILEKSKSVIGRGAVGALFGPVGAIIGAASGVGSKKKAQKKNYAVISYMGNGEIKNITIEVGNITVGAAVEFKKELDKLLFGDGPIQL